MDCYYFCQKILSNKYDTESVHLILIISIRLETDIEY